MGTGGINRGETATANYLLTPAKAINDKFGLLKLNWSFKSGSITVRFYDEGGIALDGHTPDNSLPQIKYDCHT